MLISPQDVHGSTITIRDAHQLHYVRDVLRLREGARLICFDGSGVEYFGILTEMRLGVVHVAIDRSVISQAERVAFWLAQGIPKADRFAWMVEKATELGVSRVTPLLTDRTVVRLAEPQRRVKQARWQRIAQAAAKQCGRATVPVVDAPMTLDRYAPQLAEASLVLIPTLEITAAPLEEMLRKPPEELRTVALLIGPEGDFTREEVALAQRHGARPVSLGRLTLRSETAAIAALAMLRYALRCL